MSEYAIVLSLLRFAIEHPYAFGVSAGALFMLVVAYKLYKKFWS